jgi:hypothetical protein
MTSSIVFSVTAFFRSFHTVNGSSNHGTRRTVCHLSEEKKSVHTALNRTSLFLRNEKNKKKNKKSKGNKIRQRNKIRRLRASQRGVRFELGLGDAIFVISAMKSINLCEKSLK